MNAGEDHTFMSILDRRVQLVRTHVPLLLDQPSTDQITIEAADIAAESMICLNTQLTYLGVCSYQCLFGALPRELWREDSEFVSQQSDTEPFYEHLHIR